MLITPAEGWVIGVQRQVREMIMRQSNYTKHLSSQRRLIDRANEFGITLLDISKSFCMGTYIIAT